MSEVAHPDEVGQSIDLDFVRDKAKHPAEIHDVLVLVVLHLVPQFFHLLVEQRAQGTQFGVLLLQFGLHLEPQFVQVFDGCFDGLCSNHVGVVTLQESQKLSLSSHLLSLLVDHVNTRQSVAQSIFVDDFNVLSFLLKRHFEFTIGHDGNSNCNMFVVPVLFVLLVDLIGLLHAQNQGGHNEHLPKSS